MKNTPHSASAALAVALVLSAGLALAGCASEPADNGADSGSSQNDQGATDDNGSATDDGANAQGFVDEDGVVPDWFADGFPLYPGSETAGAGEAGDTTIISFSVPSADAQEIYNWFVDQYSQSGWEPRNLDDEHMSFDADNADGRTASINVTGATYVISATQG